IQAWRRWAASRQQPVVRLTGTGLRAAVAAWAMALARHRDLIADALAYLGARIGRPPSDLRPALAAKTRKDLESFWEGLPLDASRGGPVALSRRLTGCLPTGDAVDSAQHL